MKKIIATVTNDLNFDQRMQRICTTLAEDGFEVCLLGREKKGSGQLSSRIYKQKRLNCLFEKGKLFYLEYNIRLFFYLLFQPFDILCSVDTDTLLGGGLAAIFRHKIRVMDAHELFTEVPELKGRSFSRFIWRTIEKFFYPRYDSHYTVSKSVSIELENRYSIRFATIRNVPVKKEIEKGRAAEKYILYQGALNEGRGLEELIEAADSINCRIKLAGEGDLSYVLREMVKRKKLESKIEFLGYLSPEELTRVTADAYIGLNLLKEGSINYYLSLANKFFDYVQCHVPSINMKFPEYIACNNEFEVSLLIPDLRPETISASVNNLIKDHELYVNMQRNCKMAAKKWNWENEKVKLLKIYHLLGG